MARFARRGKQRYGPVPAAAAAAPGAPTIGLLTQTNVTGPHFSITAGSPAPDTQYSVYRDGSFLAGISPFATDYQDTSAVPGTTYAYTVFAVSTGPVSSPVSNTLNIRRIVVSSASVADSAPAGGPATTTSDNFNRADGAVGSGWTALPNTGVPSIVFNQLQTAAPTAQGAIRNNTDLGTAQHYSEVEWVSDNELGTALYGPAVQMSAVGTTLSTGGSFYILQIASSGTFVTIIRKNSAASSVALLGSGVAITQLVSGDKVRLAVEGVELVGYVNGVEKVRRAMSLQPLTESPAGQFAGVYQSMTGAGAQATLDNFLASALAPDVVTWSMPTSRSVADGAGATDTGGPLAFSGSAATLVNSEAVGPHTITKPLMSNGDYVVLAIVSNKADSFATPVAPPSGFTLLTSPILEASMTLYLYGKRVPVVSSEPAWTITFTDIVKIVAEPAAYSNVDSITPIFGIVSAIDTGTSTTVASGNLNVTDTGCWLITVGARRDLTAGSWTMPDTQRTQASVTGSSQVTMGYSDTNGPVATGTYNKSAVASGSSTNGITALIALRQGAIGAVTRSLSLPRPIASPIGGNDEKVVYNETFEDGTINRWIDDATNLIANLTAQAHGGTRSLSVVAQNNTMQLNFESTVHPRVAGGIPLTMSVWIYSTVAGRQAKLGLVSIDTNGDFQDGFEMATFTPLTQNTWTRVTFTTDPITAETETVRMYGFINDPLGFQLVNFEQYYIDDYTLTGAGVDRLLSQPRPIADRGPATDEAPTPTYVGGGATTGDNLATKTLTFPSGVQAGDRAIIQWGINTTSTVTVSPTDVGFTLVDTTDDGTNRRNIYTKTCAGTESGTTVTFTDTAIGRHSAQLVVYRGASIASVTSAIEAGTDFTHESPPVTTTTPNQATVLFVMERITSGTASYLVPTGWTKRQEHAVVGSGGFTGAAADDLPINNRGTGVTVTPGSWTGSGTAAANVVTTTVLLTPTGAPGVARVLSQPRAVGDGNRYTNGGFDTDPSWSGPAGTVTHDLTVGKTKLGSVKLVTTQAGDTNVGTPWNVAGDFFPVTAGQVYTAIMSAKSGTVRNAVAQIQWYSSAAIGTNVGGSNGNSANTSTSVWTTYTSTAVAPPTAAFARFDLYIAGAAGAGETHWVDDTAFLLGAHDVWPGLPTADAVARAASLARAAREGGVQMFDDFNRPNQVGLGSYWTNLTGTSKIASNQAAPNQAFDNKLVGVVPIDAANQYAQMTIKAVDVDGTSSPGLLVRANATGDNNYYLASVDSNTDARIYKMLAGVRTTIAGSVPTVLAVNDVFSFEAQGTSLYLKVNGLVVNTVVDTSLTSGYAGFRMEGTLLRVDDFQAGALFADIVTRVYTPAGPTTFNRSAADSAAAADAVTRILSAFKSVRDTALRQYTDTFTSLTNWTGSANFGLYDGGVGSSDGAGAVGTYNQTFNADQFIEATTLINANAAASVMVRVQGQPTTTATLSGYRFRAVNTISVALYKVTNNTEVTTLTTGSFRIRAGHRLRLTAVGTTITGYINGVQVLQATDATYTSGYVGLATDLTVAGAWDDPVMGDLVITEAVTSFITRPRTAADSAPATDAVTRQLSQSRAIADTAAASDAVTRARTSARAAADTAAAVDTLARSLVEARAPPDTAAATDAVTRSRTSTRATPDTAGASDAVARSTTRSRPVADTAAASDAVTRTFTQPRAATDTAAATDTVSRSGPTPQARSVSDSAPAADSVSRSGPTPQARTASDSAPATDSVTRTVSQTRAVTDTAPATDAVTRTWSSSRTTADSAGASDSVTRSLVQARTLSDTALATDEARQTTFPIHVDDAAAASDAVTRSVTASRSVADTAGVTDAATSRTTQPRFIWDGVAAAYTDNFNRPDGTLASSTWVTTSAVPSIVSNTVKANAGTISSSRYSPNLSTPHQYAQIRIATIVASMAAGPEVRLTSEAQGTSIVSTGTGYAFTVSGASSNTLTIQRKSASSFGTLGTTVLFAISAGDVMRLEVEGRGGAGSNAITLRGYVNGVLKMTRTDTSNIQINNLGAGFFLAAGTNTIDDFAAGDLYGTPPMTDVAVATVSEARSVDDSAPASDTVSTEFSSGNVHYFSTADDTAPATDSVTRSSTSPRSVADTAPAVDTLTRTLAQSRATADNAAAADTVVRQAPQTRTVADSAPATDTIARAQAPQARSVSDSAPATDAAVSTGAGSTSATDTAGASDSVARSLTQTRPLTDTASASDTVARTFTSPRTVADSAPASDTLTRTLSAARSTADSAPATDATTRSLTQARAVSDTALATDSARQTTFPAHVDDSAPATDAVTRSVTTSRSVADTAGASDTLARSISQARATSDTAPAVDTVARTVPLTRSVSDTAPATDSIFYSATGSSNVFDSAPAVDTVLGQRRYYIRVETVLVAGNWTPNTGTIPDALNNKDESDYIYSTASTPYARLKLGSAATPNAGQRWWRARLGNVTDGVATYTINLIEGGGSTLGAGTVKGTLSTTRSTQGAVTLEVEITDPITDYADLYAEVKAEVG